MTPGQNRFLAIVCCLAALLLFVIAAILVFADHQHAEAWAFIGLAALTGGLVAERIP